MISIMIIEDDRKLTEMLCTHIEKYGYHAIAVSDFSTILDQSKFAQWMKC